MKQQVYKNQKILSEDSIYNNFYKRYQEEINPIVKRKELYVYKYIDLKEHIISLIKYIWHVGYNIGIFITISLILAGIFYFKNFSSDDLIWIAMILIQPINFTIIIIWSIIDHYKTNGAKKSFITLLNSFRKYYIIIFLKDGILGSNYFLRYDENNTKKVINETYVTLNEHILGENKYLEEEKNKKHKGDLGISILLTLLFISYQFSNNYISLLTSIVFVVYISIKYFKLLDKQILLNIIDLIKQDLNSSKISIILYLIGIGYAIWLSPLVLTLLFYIWPLLVIILFTLGKYLEKTEKYYINLKYLLLYILISFFILGNLGTYQDIVINWYFWLFAIIIFIENLANTKYGKYIFSIPIVIITFIPILIYSLFIYFKQKLFPSTNEKIYNTLLTYNNNITKIEKYYNELNQKIDEFINGKIFSLDKYISKNFKIINKLIDKNFNIIEKKLLQLINENTTLKENINISNLKKQNNIDYKEFINKILSIVNNNINQIQNKLNSIENLKDNPNYGNLKLKQIELEHTLTNLHNQKVILNNYLKQL